MFCFAKSANNFFAAKSTDRQSVFLYCLCTTSSSTKSVLHHYLWLHQKIYWSHKCNSQPQQPVPSSWKTSNWAIKHILFSHGIQSCIHVKDTSIVIAAETDVSNSWFSAATCKRHSHSRLAGWLCAWYCSSLLVGKRPCSGGLWLCDQSHRALIEASTGNNTLVLLPLVAQLGCGRQLCRKEVDIWSYSRHQWRRTTQWLTERYPASASKRFYHSISLVHAAEMTTLLRWRHST